MNKLVLDIGGSSIKYACMDNEATILAKGSVPTPLDTLENLLISIHGVYEQYKGKVDGIAISMPGNLDCETGLIISGGALLYNAGINFYDALKTMIDVPVTIENDGKCAALAEAWKGNLEDCQDGIVLVLGTGIGGGIIKDKKLHKGKHFFAGEFSFMMCSHTGFDFMNAWAIQSSTTALVHGVADKKGLDPNTIDGRKVFDWVNEGDQEAMEVFDHFIEGLAVGIYNLHCVYDPEKFLIGGGISQQPILLEKLREKIATVLSSLPVTIPPIEIDICKYFNDSNLIGALYNFKQMKGF